MHPEKSSRSITRLYLSTSTSSKRGTAPPPARESVGSVTSDPGVLKKRPSSGTAAREKVADSPTTPLGAKAKALDQIGKPDLEGWLRKKGERYNSWKPRYLVLKGPDLYYLRSKSVSAHLHCSKCSADLKHNLQEAKIKGYINIVGYKVIADENADPGKYGFRIIHDTERPHYFSSEEQGVVREWMKAIMKATIGRDYSRS